MSYLQLLVFSVSCLFQEYYKMLCVWKINKANPVFHLIGLHSIEIWQSSSDNTCQIQLLYVSMAYYS